MGHPVLQMRNVMSLGKGKLTQIDGPRVVEFFILFWKSQIPLGQPVPPTLGETIDRCLNVGVIEPVILIDLNIVQAKRFFDNCSIFVLRTISDSLFRNLLSETLPNVTNPRLKGKIRYPTYSRINQKSNLHLTCLLILVSVTESNKQDLRPPSWRSNLRSSPRVHHS